MRPPATEVTNNTDAGGTRGGAHRDLPARCRRGESSSAATGGAVTTLLIAQLMRPLAMEATNNVDVGGTRRGAHHDLPSRRSSNATGSTIPRLLTAQLTRPPATEATNNADVGGSRREAHCDLPARRI